MKSSVILVCALIGLSLCLGGCSRRQQDWEAARKANTPEAYETFLQKYPEGEFTAQAQASARELEETRDWQNAVAANTAAAYQEFLRVHPDGRMSDDARIRIENFAMAAAGDATATPPPVPGEPAPASASAPAQKGAAPPAPMAMQKTPPAGTMTAAATAGHAYRVQLGAFSGGEKQAMGEWRRLLREHPQLLDGLTPSVKLATTNTGHLYRLQAGFTDEAGARAICAKLKADGQSCVVVVP